MFFLNHFCYLVSSNSLELLKYLLDILFNFVFFVQLNLVFFICLSDFICGLTLLLFLLYKLFLHIYYQGAVVAQFLRLKTTCGTLDITYSLVFFVLWLHWYYLCY